MTVKHCHRSLCIYLLEVKKKSNSETVKPARVSGNGCLLAHSRQPGTPSCSCMSNQSACLSLLFIWHHFQESFQPRRRLFPLPSSQPPASSEALCQCWWCSEKSRSWLVQEKALHAARHCRSIWRCTHLRKQGCIDSLFQ